MSVAPTALDALTLARWQFGITTVYHFILVPLTIGLSLFVACMQTMWLRTGKDYWLKATRLFGKLFLINFALGVSTGIVQEFQFGMNWSEYSRYVGDIFGAPLAVEALLSFFLESTFIGLWIFGWGRLSKKAHTAMIWLAALGVNTSALWIIGANSWMQHPVGAVFNAETGRAELDGTSGFLEVVFNPTLWLAWLHVLTTSWLLSAGLIAGVAMWWMVRTARAGATTSAGAKNLDVDQAARAARAGSSTVAASNSDSSQVSAHQEALEESQNVWHPITRFGLMLMLVAGILTGITGHMEGVHMVAEQPTKMAAAEAICNTQSHAPFTIAAFGSECGADGKGITHVGQIPSVASILSGNSPSTEVEGMNDLNKSYASDFGVDKVTPPVMATFWSFRAMIGLGLISMIFALVGLYATRKGKVSTSTGLAKFGLAMIPFPLLGIAFGWIFTEIGRQPFVVFPNNLDSPVGQVWMLTQFGVSGAVPAVQVLLTMILFTVLYGALGVIWLLLMIRYAKEGVHTAKASDGQADHADDQSLSFAY
ncbi:MAG: cytochrome ubiquinol oxidase subunit I [Winkia neuii]|uniref:Cytochrome ubiquinol oxidase subunit I n=1 Tax=Winkia neuii TaxID=33007 RepID=A0A2I1IKK6_9ACTO|nr:cytochrome ubiquinol oxidase subunit I [Winkia neuii]OFJ72730.1 cytochrome BD ubiquinol oxidase subunit I [Actinomyces sp. HMSC064C12]OFK04914.1 cytochrome BD ubiquinol oxidase subunit I [Actinomyces sp. HMSC072A03]OFT55220.1 cytochrome BD ubiquinol oxidase subunit I [Actinomyces sp. HMSC06A08]MDK8099479.1 cytochrome ubiquinol oxidase subunit I [Winkia neuii]MDU3135169.1 cytochrome ubiquinol oxidase subunit I [Winkia neuii]